MKPLPTSLRNAALCRSETEAFAAWKEWREQVDIQHLSWPEIQLLPLLNGPRLSAWLAKDEAAGLLKGIVRRAWTEAQVRMATAQAAAAQLEQAGCGPVILSGATGLHPRNRAGATAEWIRPITQIELLIRREALTPAVRALQDQGWQLYGDGEIPGGEALDWCMHLPLKREGLRLHLSWRVIDVVADHAEDCERAFLVGCESIEIQGGGLLVLDATHSLLELMTRKDAALKDDQLPWQIDSALLLQEQIDWERWKELAAAYCLTAFDRLTELRSLGLEVPVLSAPMSPRITMRQHLAAQRHAMRNAIRRTSHRLIQRLRREARRLLPVEVKR